MNIKLAYDRDGLDVTLPLNGEHLEIVEPKFVPGLEDSPAALRQALKTPVAAPPSGSSSATSRAPARIP